LYQYLEGKQIPIFMNQRTKNIFKKIKQVLKLFYYLIIFNFLCVSNKLPLTTV